MRQVKRKRRIASLSSFLSCDLSILEHRIDNQVSSFKRAVGMMNGRIGDRRLRKSHNQRRLRQRELLRRLAEVKFRCRLKPVHTMSKVNLVGVKRKDLFLCEPSLHLDGEQHFLNFAMERSVRRNKQISRNLHLAAGFHVAIRRAHDAPDVHSAMAKEIFVFRRDQSLNQHIRKVVVSGYYAPLQRERSDNLSVNIVK